MVWFFFGQKLVKAAEDARKDHEYRKHLQVKKTHKLTITSSDNIVNTYR